MAGGTVKEPARDVGGGRLVATVTGDQTDQESRSAGPRAASRLLLAGRSRTRKNLHRRER
jgi:hypothetical protein